MQSDKEIKAQFQQLCDADPEKHYPVATLKELDFARKKCDKCGRHFWSGDQEQKVCGDPACSGGFRFIGKKPTKKTLDYIEVWKAFAKIHKKLGYTPIDRYPVVARWNPTTDFTIASIAAFQPYVVSGEIDPPANPLVIPQFCLRFPDIDNVGITGHNVGFVMMGEHAFVPPKEYDTNKYLKDHLTWLQEGMGISTDQLTVHEDVWAGGGNYGPCVEFFSHGLEISNQVYMQYEVGPHGSKELKIKVLDMGQGQERAAWFTQGTPTNYDAIFPSVMKKLTKATSVSIDPAFMQRFVPLSPYLNVNEVENIDQAWKDVAKKLKLSVDKLKEQLMPIAGLYSVAEHTRALLIAISDGALPSNVGGMYNLRVILRRALGFIDKFGWDVSLGDVCDWHAAHLKPQFPELKEHADSVRAILDFEKKKYDATKKKTKNILRGLIERKLSTEDLIELYDSQGISPDLIQEEAIKAGKKIKVPENFYGLVAEKHEQERPVTATEREEAIPLGELPATKALYFDNYQTVVFEGKVLKILGKYIVLDQTAFYPTSGGQLHDTGELNGVKVVDVFKQAGLIVHQLEKAPTFKEGDKVKGEIDYERRLQMAQHHTATHIVNTAARRVLGHHINQASAKKDVDKAHLDVTHFKLITGEELKKIEEEANKIVQSSKRTVLKFLPRQEAEQQYGMHIYQGGAVPGKQIRIVEIPSVDVEACGGTHLNNTKEAGRIKILKASKVKDGIVRLVFAAGKAAEHVEQESKGTLDAVAKELGVPQAQVPARMQELFTKWKQARKAHSKKKELAPELFTLTSTEETKGTSEEILQKAAQTLQTQPEHVLKTIQRFKKDLKMWSSK